jgi:NAD(P)-dependent dehydrogenase (short-subunit alcohol dehydrogenase family)
MSNIVITGTSSGFGRAMVETLAADGHTIFACMRDTAARNAKPAQELSKLGTKGGRVHVVEMDVTSDTSVTHAIDKIVSETGGAIDVLVNNAGRLSAGVQEAYTLDQVKGLFESNVFGLLRVNRAVLPHMRKRGSGLVINTSSIMGRYSLPCLGVYCATKFAVEALVEAQRDELKAVGIDVVAVEPGAFPTSVADNALWVFDPDISAAYGSIPQLPQKLGEVLGQLYGSASSPRPQEVADAVQKLVKTPAGKRPHRVVVDTYTGTPVDALNAIHASHRPGVVKAYGMGEVI